MRALQRRRQRLARRRPRSRRKPASPPKARQTASTICRRRGLVERDAQACVAPMPRLIFSAARARDDLARACAPTSTVTRVEEGLRLRRKAELAQACRQHGGAAMHVARDLRQPFGAVIDRVHRGDHGEQHLRGADVGGRLLAADVLLAGLQRQAIGRLRRANRPTGRRCGRAASASAHRAPPYRPRAGRHSPSARRSAAPSRSRCRRRVRRARRAASAPARSAATIASAPLACSAAIAGRRSRTAPERAGILQQRAEHRRHLSRSAAGSPTISFQPSGSARVRSTASVCGCTSRVDEEGFCLRLRGALGQRHGFGRGGRLVEQRGVGDVEPGEVADHGLEIEQRLQPALADLGLIGRIGRVPGRVFQDVALDHRGQDRAGIALADQRGEELVLRARARAYAQAPRSRSAACRDRAAPAAGSRPAGSPPSAPSRLAAPTVSSIAAMSRGEGPIWRRTKSVATSSYGFAVRGHVCVAAIAQASGRVRAL